MSGWIIFNICFTTLLVGTWAAFTIFEFHRTVKKMRETELRGLTPRALTLRRDGRTSL